MSQVPAIFNAEERAAIVYEVKAGMRTISAEGALFKGGKALKSLKDAALDSALDKAVNGRYRAAADIIGASFSGLQTSFERVIGPAHANKDNMRTFLAAVERTTPPAGKDFTPKQVNALQLVKALREIDALKPAEVKAEDVVAVQ